MLEALLFNEAAPAGQNNENFTYKLKHLETQTGPRRTFAGHMGEEKGPGVGVKGATTK